MKVISVSGRAMLDQEQANNNGNESTNTMLKSTDIQSMLRPLVDIDQTDRSNTISAAQRCSNDILNMISDSISNTPTAIRPTDTTSSSTNTVSTPTHRLPGISEVLPSLYLCGAGVAIPCFIEQLAVTCVVNAAPELPDTPLPASRPLYYQVPVLDRGDNDLMRYFDEVADLLEQVRLAGGRSMVHCVAGVSRSASLCIAYLMKHTGMRLREAFEHVRRARPQIRPNVGFFRQLIEYERLLHGGASVQFIFVESLAQEIPDVYEPEYRAMEVFYQKHRHIKRR